jgi:hypothetical protein
LISSKNVKDLIERRRIVMNHWLTEELMWLRCTERERELKVLHLCAEVDKLRANWTVIARAGLKLSDWLIATGEGLRRRYEKIAPASL